LTLSSHRRLAAAITSATLLAATVVLSGCSGGSGSGSSDDAQSTGRIVALLVDQTCDASPALTALARDAFDKAVGAAASDQGTFLGEAITTDEYQTGTFAVSEAFTSDKANDAGQQRDLDRQARRFADTPEAATLTKGYANGTACGSDLINALSAADRAFKDEPGQKGRARDLVFVTNGIVIDDAAGVNFVEDDITPAYTARLIKRQKAKDLFPDLSGVTVHLVGLGVSDQPLSAAQVRGIESFWEKIVAEAGASEVNTVRTTTQLGIGGDQ
jgi:hypothetical protein